MIEALNSMCKSAGCFTVTEAKNTFLPTDPDNRTRPDIVVVNFVLDVKITESDIKHLTRNQGVQRRRENDRRISSVFAAA
jgi:AmiR/NasT family two-component response regulator